MRPEGWGQWDANPYRRASNQRRFVKPLESSPSVHRGGDWVLMGGPYVIDHGQRRSRKEKHYGNEVITLSVELGRLVPSV